LAFGLAPMRIASITAGEPSKAPRARICDTTASKVCFSIMPGECSAAPLQRRARSRRRARIQRGESCCSRYGANQSTMYCSSSEAGLVPRHALPLAALPASSRTRRWRRIIISDGGEAAVPRWTNILFVLVRFHPARPQSPNLGASHQACQSPSMHVSTARHSLSLSLSLHRQRKQLAVVRVGGERRRRRPLALSPSISLIIISITPLSLRAWRTKNCRCL